MPGNKKQLQPFNETYETKQQEHTHNKQHRVVFGQISQLLMVTVIHCHWQHQQQR
jgi:hypothetical protein